MTTCPFCDPRPDSIVAQDEHAVALRDRYPVVDGHTLVVPRRHVESAFDLSANELASLWALVARVRGALAVELGANSFTVGLNDGIAAGQTVMHAHVHVIPRRTGDVEDPRGGIRWVIPSKAAYWNVPAQ